MKGLLDKLRYGFNYDPADGDPNRLGAGTRCGCRDERSHDADCPQCHQGGLSRTQHDLHVKEQSAGFWGDWGAAADAKQMLENADSRGHWERKAVEMRDMYIKEGDPEFAQKIYNTLMNNARNAPNK